METVEQLTLVLEELQDCWKANIHNL